jgi:hypothetical protein
VLVTGSREWKDWRTFSRAMVELQVQHAEMYYDSQGEPVDYDTEGWVIVHGACPTGADAMADEWASVNFMTVERHPAQWDQFGRGAGFRRNQEMVDLGADICLGFIINGANKSRGTRDCLRRAVSADIPVLTYYPEVADVVEGLP